MATPTPTKTRIIPTQGSSLSGLVCLAAAAILFCVGVSQLPEIVFGAAPWTLYGLWAVVAAVAVAGHIADRMNQENAAFRMRDYGSVPSHQPSIYLASAAGVLVALFAWAARRDAVLVAACSGVITGFIVYLSIGRLWRASWFSGWTLQNAHCHRVLRVVVEGRTGTQGQWMLVGATDDVLQVSELRARAHAEYEKVRFWRVESYVTLMQSDAAPGLMVASPADAATVPEDEARRVTRMGC